MAGRVRPSRERPFELGLSLVGRVMHYYLHHVYEDSVSEVSREIAISQVLGGQVYHISASDDWIVEWLGQNVLAFMNQLAYDDPSVDFLVVGVDVSARDSVVGQTISVVVRVENKSGARHSALLQTLIGHDDVRYGVEHFARDVPEWAEFSVGPHAFGNVERHFIVPDDVDISNVYANIVDGDGRILNRQRFLNVMSVRRDEEEREGWWVGFINELRSRWQTLQDFYQRQLNQRDPNFFDQLATILTLRLDIEDLPIPLLVPGIAGAELGTVEAVIRSAPAAGSVARVFLVHWPEWLGNISRVERLKYFDDLFRLTVAEYNDVIRAVNQNADALRAFTNGFREWVEHSAIRVQQATPARVAPIVDDVVEFAGKNIGAGVSRPTILNILEPVAPSVFGKAGVVPGTRILADAATDIIGEPALLNMAAEEILAIGTRSPAVLKQLIRAVPEDELIPFFNRLKQVDLGKSAVVEIVKKGGSEAAPRLGRFINRPITMAGMVASISVFLGAVYLLKTYVFDIPAYATNLVKEIPEGAGMAVWAMIEQAEREGTLEAWERAAEANVIYLQFIENVDEAGTDIAARHPELDDLIREIVPSQRNLHAQYADIITRNIERLSAPGAETEEEIWERRREEQDERDLRRREEEDAHYAAVIAEAEARRLAAREEDQARWDRIIAEAEERRRLQREADDAYFAGVRERADADRAEELIRTQEYWEAVRAENERREAESRAEEQAYWDEILGRREEEPPTPPAPGAQLYRLTVLSNPPGARIMLNGQVVERDGYLVTTPNYVILEAGTYWLTVYKSGYEIPAEVEVNIE